MSIIDTLKIALSEKIPGLKDYQIDRCVNKYYSGVMSEIFTQYMLNDDVPTEFIFHKSLIYRKIGRISINKEYNYIYDVMQQFNSTRLIVETYRGNSISHVLSRVNLNPMYKNEITNEI